MRKFLPLICFLLLSVLSCNSSKYAYNKKIRQFEKKLRKEKTVVRLAVIEKFWTDDSVFATHKIHFVEIEPFLGYRIAKLNTKMVSAYFDRKDSLFEYMMIRNSPGDSVFVVFKRPDYFDTMPRLINRKWSVYKSLQIHLRNASLFLDDVHVKSRRRDDTSFYYAVSDSFYFYRQKIKFYREYSTRNVNWRQLIVYNSQGKMVSRHYSLLNSNIYGEGEYFFKEITEVEMNDIYTLARYSPTDFIEFSREYMRGMKLQLGNIEKLK